jgi:hypothetical protein
VCGKEPISWLDRLRERRRKIVAQLDVDRQARKAMRRLNTRPSRDLADDAGDYDHPGCGRITIIDVGGKLNWAYRGMSEPLAHRHYDTFELPEAPGRLLPDRLTISFSTDREGNIASLAAPFEPLVKDIVFTRIPAGDCTNPSFRQHCTGTFSQGVTTVVVGQDDDGQLTLTVGSQPTYKLGPYQGRTFVIDELEGFRVEFHQPGRGSGRVVLPSAEWNVHGSASVGCGVSLKQMSESNATDRLQLKTAFFRLPRVHRADLEGPLRVDLTGSPSRRRTTGNSAQRTAGIGRVEVWRSDVRLSMSVPAPFVWRSLSGSAVDPATASKALA